MKIKSIEIIEGLSGRRFDFCDKVNLIHSDFNSCGKTTLLRFLAYALGYPIPSTKKIKFEKCIVKARVNINGDDIHIERMGSNLKVMSTHESCEFVLPLEESRLHAFLYKKLGDDYAHNLLGAFYIDQEKGWTLLNRGVVIGNIKFNIKEFVLWTSGKPYKSEKLQLKQIDNETEKYKKLYDIAQYQDQIIASNGIDIVDSSDNRVLGDLVQKQFKLARVNKELLRLKDAIKSNKQFLKFVEEMKLGVISPSGEVFPLKKENIQFHDENTSYLDAKQRMLKTEQAHLLKDIDNIKEQLEYKPNNQPSLGLDETAKLLTKLENKFSKLGLSQLEVKDAITSLKAQEKIINQGLKEQVFDIDSTIYELYGIIKDYALELGLKEYIKESTSFLLTSDLKSYSGAILHKLVFAFKMGYIKLAEKKLGYKLPIIIDSPRGKEVDKKNVQQMIDILNRDFADNQIFIASIYEYDIPEEKLTKHSIKNCLLNLAGQSEE